VDFYALTAPATINIDDLATNITYLGCYLYLERHEQRTLVLYHRLRKDTFGHCWFPFITQENAPQDAAYRGASGFHWSRRSLVSCVASRTLFPTGRFVTAASLYKYILNLFKLLSCLVGYRICNTNCCVPGSIVEWYDFVDVGATERSTKSWLRSISRPTARSEFPIVRGREKTAILLRQIAFQSAVRIHRQIHISSPCSPVRMIRRECWC